MQSKEPSKNFVRAPQGLKLLTKILLRVVAKGSGIIKPILDIPNLFSTRTGFSRSFIMHV